MPLESPLAPISERVVRLNIDYRHHSAADVLGRAISDPKVGRTALVSSFGAQSVVLLHMLAQIDRTAQVLFIDTELLFEETLSYQRDLSKQLGLINVQVVRPDRRQLFLHDTDATLHRKDPDACCDMRKTRPLQQALSGFDAWITGRKRFQGHQRKGLEFFETDNDARIKINPLAHWKPRDVQDYITNNGLPRHPLVARGYPSIGCAPCTTPVSHGEDPRAGRWRGNNKVECGIHWENGKLVRGARPEGI